MKILREKTIRPGLITSSGFVVFLETSFWKPGFQNRVGNQVSKTKPLTSFCCLLRIWYIRTSKEKHLRVPGLNILPLRHPEMFFLFYINTKQLHFYYTINMKQGNKESCGKLLLDIDSLFFRINTLSKSPGRRVLQGRCILNPQNHIIKWFFCKRIALLVFFENSKEFFVFLNKK